MPKKTFSLYLAKDSVGGFEEVFTEETLTKIGQPSSMVIDDPHYADGARLFVFVGRPYSPQWLTDLRASFTITEQVLTSSAAAVLLFWAAGRLFASTFAHGWMYLDDLHFEGDFGLRAAVNALDDEKLKRVERANLGDALRGVALSPFQRGLTAFGLDDALDLIRKISGRTRGDDQHTDSMTGSKSLRITGEFRVDDLPELARQAIEYYTSSSYQSTQFSILDSVRPVVDRQLEEFLDQEAAASIRGGMEEFELGLPLSFSDDAVSFKFMGPGRRGLYPDLLLRHYAAAMGDRLSEIDMNTLKEHKIVASFDDDNRPNAKWSIRSALVGSLVHNGERYAINEGEWYQIEQSFKDTIEAGYRSMVEDWDSPPEPFRKIYAGLNGRYETEADYNARFAELNNYVLLDRALIRVPGVERSDFETCDAIDLAAKRFIHIKKSSRRSSILSHFFKQGSNSARHFSTFASSWTSLREIIVNQRGPLGGEELDAAREEARPWKVEYVIADTPRQTGEFNIPFFSKVTLRDEVRSLRAMQYDVGLRFIRLQPDAFSERLGRAARG